MNMTFSGRYMLWITCPQCGRTVERLDPPDDWRARRWKCAVCGGVAQQRFGDMRYGGLSMDELERFLKRGDR